jgi:cell division septation protein DedD
MSEELTTSDDQSHYEISLTAGQAFLAFVLLLLSLAASFAFGLMIGKGQADERLVVRKEPAVIQEGSATGSKKATEGRIVDLGVTADEFKAAAAKPQARTGADASGSTPMIAEGTTLSPAVAKAAETVPSVIEPSAAAAKPVDATKAPATPATKAVATPAVPHDAQLLSTGDQKTAEALAAKLINGGFTSAYVERGTTDKGPIFRVRVRFPSEGDARAAETKLHEYSKDVWITK